MSADSGTLSVMKNGLEDNIIIAAADAAGTRKALRQHGWSNPKALGPRIASSYYGSCWPNLAPAS